MNPRHPQSRASTKSRGGREKGDSIRLPARGAQNSISISRRLSVWKVLFFFCAGARAYSALTIARARPDEPSPLLSSLYRVNLERLARARGSEPVTRARSVLSSGRLIYLPRTSRASGSSGSTECASRSFSRRGESPPLMVSRGRRRHCQMRRGARPVSPRAIPGIRMYARVYLSATPCSSPGRGDFFSVRRSFFF